MTFKITLFFAVVLLPFFANAQVKDSLNLKETNPILFFEYNFGVSTGTFKGFGIGANLQYQKNKHLFTLKVNQTTSSIFEPLFFYLPISLSRKKNVAYSFLYGKRHIEHNYAFHYSAGVSYNSYRLKEKRKVIETSNHFGVPLEVGINWFKSTKRRLALFGLIPIGKPTGFGTATGLKLHANLAKKSFVGLSLTTSFGWHKTY